MARKTREEIIQNMKNNGWLNKTCIDFYSLPDDKKHDIKIFEDFCKIEGGYRAILLSNEEVCDDKEFVLMAKKYGYYGDFFLISGRLLADPDIALALADCNKYQYTSISLELRNDPKLMLEAVKINPRICISLPVSVRTNPDILMEIANSAPYELGCMFSVREELRNKIFNDKELAMVVAKSSPQCLFEFFSERVLQDDEILEIALNISDKNKLKENLYKYPEVLYYLDKKYWIDDKKLIEKALRKDPRVYFKLSNELKNNRVYAQIVVKRCPRFLEDLSDELRDDAEIVKAALQMDSDEILSFASKRLQGDYNIVYKAVTVDPVNLLYASDELKDNREIVLQAIKLYGGVLDYASVRLQHDEELVSVANKNM